MINQFGDLVASVLHISKDIFNRTFFFFIKPLFEKTLICEFELRHNYYLLYKKHLTWMRSRISDERLNRLVSLHSHRNIVISHEIIDIFSQLKCNRRLDFVIYIFIKFVDL